MTNSSRVPDEHQVFFDHLAQWGLRRVDTDAAYATWQRSQLSAQQLQQLSLLSQRRQGGVDMHADVEFYDMAASPSVLPVLYSQRYEFYETVGLAVAARLQHARQVLDFGCGVGILTTLYAKLHPAVTFVGIDRSPQSVARAQQFAQEMNLSNVQFIQGAIPDFQIAGQFDCMISTHALFQAEADPGLPSQGWDTFAREHNDALQMALEKQTGLHQRLDALVSYLEPDGQWILVEKARHVGRRILLQRALARRDLHLVEEPQNLSYATLGEKTLDGPLYQVTRRQNSIVLPWNEDPERYARQRLYGCLGSAARDLFDRLPNRTVTHTQALRLASHGDIQIGWGGIGNVLTYGWFQIDDEIRGIQIGGVDDGTMIAHDIEEILTRAANHPSWNCYLELYWPSSSGASDPQSLPLYENHTPSAQDLWSALPGRIVFETYTSEEPDGRQRHIELGGSENFAYLYWANTYDQRQLVIMESQRKFLLKQYYDESLHT
ncbi:MAG: methyltransferase domain-containing protein [Nitrospirales bacterium]|nr:methyltransferase domain-containing protein [Nitrospirales bacterium]